MTKMSAKRKAFLERLSDDDATVVQLAGESHLPGVDHVGHNVRAKAFIARQFADGRDQVGECLWLAAATRFWCVRLHALAKLAAEMPALSTDLYQLTMAAAYFESGVRQRATFEMFVRALPPQRAYLIFAGLEQALDHLTNLRFTRGEIDYLRRQPVFKHVSREFFDFLAELRFTGEVWAMAEGTAVFGREPLLRVTAPIIEAQLVETFLLSTINFQTLIASKAARVVTAAQGRDVIDFGTRRAHGPPAGMMAARAAYIGGCTGTSNAEAGYRFGIPVYGTLAHSFIMAFDNEEEAFRAFLKVFPETATILVDTYDTIAAVKLLARKFGPNVPAV